MTVPSDAELQAVLARQESRPGDGVRTFIFDEGEQVPADHPAVLAFPQLFAPAPAAGREEAWLRVARRFSAALAPQLAQARLLSRHLEPLFAELARVLPRRPLR